MDGLQQLISRSVECDVHCKAICITVQYKSFSHFPHNQFQHKYTTQAQRKDSPSINTLRKINGYEEEGGERGNRAHCKGEGEILINAGDEMKISQCEDR
jgi:hypothetical protein